MTPNKASLKRAAESSISPSKRSKRVSTGKPVSYAEASGEEDVDSKPTSKSPKKIRKSTGKVANGTILVETEVKVEVEVEVKAKVSKNGAHNTQIIEEFEETEIVKEEGKPKAKVQRKAKTKQIKPSEAMPLASRTIGSKILVGAHVSGAGGVQNAVMNSIHIGGNAFALFLKSQRKWANPPLQEEQRDLFLANCSSHNYANPKNKIPPIVPHGSYLVNLAHPDADRTKQAYDSFIDDLDRCRRLDIKLYNFHPGNAAGASDKTVAITHLAKQLNKAHNDPKSGSVITLLETMATPGGNTLGSTFEEIASIIDQVEKKDRVGVCLDTCHVFAAGYDLRAPDAFQETMQKFEKIIGMNYLMALHMNDSKAPLASGRDLHANIGTGFLGLRSFWNLVNDQRLWGIPMVLETPIDVKDEKGKSTEDKSIWAREIKLLESLVGMDIQGGEYKTLEKELQLQGKAERERIQDQVNRRGQKSTPKKGKGKKKEVSSDDEDD